MKKGIRMALALGSSLVVWVSASASPVAISAATVHTFHFRLEGSQVAPPVNTDGTGWCTVTLDDVTGDVTVTGEFACLNGNITGVHIHGPAARGQSAGIGLCRSGTGCFEAIGAFSGISRGFFRKRGPFQAGRGIREVKPAGEIHCARFLTVLI